MKILSFHNLIILKTFTIFLFFINANIAFSVESNFRQVEAVGRAVIVEGDIQISRKRALEDAIYIAALKGGAKIDGFSSIRSDTVINEQSIITPTNNVIDFKILKETQDKEFLSIKISAIVGTGSISKNCKMRPINISLFQGFMNISSNAPSKLARKMSVWYNEFYKVLSETKNVSALDFRDKNFESIRASSRNSEYDYKALTNGLPIIQAGDYSMVPVLSLLDNSDYNSKSNNPLNEGIKYYYKKLILKVSLDIYKGSDFKKMPSRDFYIPIDYQYDSKFSFLRSISTMESNQIDINIIKNLKKFSNNLFYEFNCRPLEGKLNLINGILNVDIGSMQGLENKQIGIVKGLNIKNSMLDSNMIVLQTVSIGANQSKLMPLNDNVKLENLNNLIVEFVE